MSKIDRRLSAIMFTDIYGYSRLMNKSEEHALELLRFHDEVTGKHIRENNGSLIKRMGDATFSEFTSCLNAFKAANQVHNELRDYNKDKSFENRLIIRVGIHIGDVVVRDGDLFGDGVNTAARLEKLALPGGTCLSDAAYSAIRGLTDTPLHRIDKVELKNISGELTIYLSDSIYPGEFPLPDKQEQPGLPSNFRIRSMKKVPPEKRGSVESLLMAVFIMALINAFMIVFNSLLTGNSLKESALLFIENTFFLLFIIIYDAVFIVIITLLRTRSAMKVTFEDVRGIDKLLNLVVQKVGFRKPSMKEEDLVFKPTTYNLIMFNTQKMIVNISGNHVIISGSALFIRRVRKLLKAYES